MEYRDKIHTLDGLLQLIREQQYKHVSLRSIDGQIMVPINPPRTSVEKRLNEIVKRVQVLPDGVYAIRCQSASGAQFYDIHYFGKGKYDKDILNSPKSQSQQIIIQQPQVMSERPAAGLLTYEQSFSMIQENSDLKARNMFLEQQNALLQERINLLEAKIDERDEDNLGENSTLGFIGSTLKEIVPSIIPVFDRHFDLQEKKIALAEKKLERGAVKQLPKPPAQPPAQQKPQSLLMTPPPAHDTVNFAKYIEEIKFLNDDDFAKYMEMLQQQQPELYALVENLVYDDNGGEA